MKTPMRILQLLAINLMMSGASLRAHLPHSFCGTGSGSIEIISGQSPKSCAAGDSCIKACSGGDGDACYFLGLFFNHAQPDHYDDDLALQYFQAGCEAGSDKACREYGSWKADWDELPDRRDAIESLETACLSGGLHSCAARSRLKLWVPEVDEERPERAELIAISKAANDALPKWRERAIAAARAGCRSSETFACHLWTDLLENDDPDFIPAQARAERLARQDCLNGDGIGCTWWEKDLKGKPAAPEWLDAERGAGLRADELFLRNCETDGNWIACYNYFTHSGKQGEPGDEESPYQKFFRREAEWALSALDAGCKFRQPRACRAYISRIENENPKTALELLLATCHEGEAESCLKLARKLLAGEGAEQQIPRAIELYESNCAYGGCRVLAGIYGGDYEQPVPLPLNLPLARNYLALGCRAGDVFSCEDYDRGSYVKEEHCGGNQCNQ